MRENVIDECRMDIGVVDVVEYKCNTGSCTPRRTLKDPKKEVFRRGAGSILWLVSRTSPKSRLSCTAAAVQFSSSCLPRACIMFIRSHVGHARLFLALVSTRYAQKHTSLIGT